MIRVNLIEDLIMSQIRDSYQALSDEDKKTFNKKRKAELRERIKKYKANQKPALEKNSKIKTKEGKSKGGISIAEDDRSLYLPARLLPLEHPEDALVRVTKTETE